MDQLQLFTENAEIAAATAEEVANLYEKIKSEFPEIKLIASGGVVSIEELEKLNELGMYGAIVGKAFYEGNIKLSSLSKFN